MEAMLHVRNNRFFFPGGKKLPFLCKIFSLFLPCNMAAVQNLYGTEISLQLRLMQEYHLKDARHFNLKVAI